MAQAILSAVLITKNRPQSVQRLINSITAQTVLPDEIVLVNDGGEDLLLHHERVQIRILRHETSLGPVESRNDGVRNAIGDLVLMLDDDVELDGPRFIEKALTPFKDSKIGIVFPRKIDVTPTRTFEFSYFEHSLLTGETKGISLERTQKRLSEGKAILGPMVYFIRREAYLKIGGHDLIYGYGIGHSFREESDFQLRLQKAGIKAALAPECFFKHHIQKGGGHGKANHKKLFWTGHNQVIYCWRHCQLAPVQIFFFAILELPRYSWGNGKFLSYPAGLLGMLSGFLSVIYDFFREIPSTVI